VKEATSRAEQLNTSSPSESMSNFIVADLLDFLRGLSWPKTLTALNVTY
jgi:hypothetical protein